LEVTVAKKKRSIPKPKSVIGNSSSGKNIGLEYAEVLRLRQAVHQAEKRSKASTSGVSSSRQKD
jgi:hypothetical protein